MRNYVKSHCNNSDSPNPGRLSTVWFLFYGNYQHNGNGPWNFTGDFYDLRADNWTRSGRHGVIVDNDFSIEGHLRGKGMFIILQCIILDANSIQWSTRMGG